MRQNYMLIGCLYDAGLIFVCRVGNDERQMKPTETAGIRHSMQFRCIISSIPLYRISTINQIANNFAFDNMRSRKAVCLLVTNIFILRWSLTLKFYSRILGAKKERECRGNRYAFAIRQWAYSNGYQFIIASAIIIRGNCILLCDFVCQRNQCDITKAGAWNGTQLKYGCAEYEQRRRTSWVCKVCFPMCPSVSHSLYLCLSAKSICAFI